MNGAEIEPSVEAVAECTEIAHGIFVEVEGMAATRQAGLEIAKDGVDPAELRHVPRFTPCHD